MKVCIVGRLKGDKFKLKEDLLEVLNNLDIDYEIATSVDDALTYAKDFDFLFLPGGPDINPKRYKEKINGAVKINDELDELDFRYIEEFNKLNKPILGICRGLQSINVYFGGSLFQDIKKHKLNNNRTHDVVINKNDFIYDIYKTNNVQVNSRHHQSIKNVAPGFVVCATANDGTIEAIHKNNVYAVQWHPETMKDYKFFNYFFK